MRLGVFIKGHVRDSCGNGTGQYLDSGWIYDPTHELKLYRTKYTQVQLNQGNLNRLVVYVTMNTLVVILWYNFVECDCWEKLSKCPVKTAHESAMT